MEKYDILLTPEQQARVILALYLKGFCPYKKERADDPQLPCRKRDKVREPLIHYRLCAECLDRWLKNAVQEKVPTIYLDK